MKTGNENKTTNETAEKVSGEKISDLADFLDDIQNTLSNSIYSSSEDKKTSADKNEREKTKKTPSVVEKFVTNPPSHADSVKEDGNNAAGNKQENAADGAMDDFYQDFNNIFDIIKNNKAKETKNPTLNNAVENTPAALSIEADEDIKIYDGGNSEQYRAEKTTETKPDNSEDYFFDELKNDIISSKAAQTSEKIMNIIDDAEDMADSAENDIYNDAGNSSVKTEKLHPSSKNRAKTAPVTVKKTAPAYEKIKNSVLYKFSETEYKSFDQTDGVFKQLSKYYMWEIIHLAACIVFFLAEFYLEIAPFFLLKLPYALDINYYNTVYILINGQILLLSCAVMNKSLIYGFKSLIKNIINIHAVAFIIALATLLQTLLTYIIMYNKPGIRLYNSIAAGMFVFIAAGNILSVRKESLAFKTVCTKKNKFGVKILKNNSREADNFKEYINDGTKIGLSQLASFISNFFSTANKKTENKPLKIILLAVIAISVIIFAVLTILKNDVYSSISNIIFFMLASVPFCASITAVYPFYNTQMKLKEKGAAIIGEESIETYSNVSVFSVYDKDIFPPELIKISGIRIYKNNRIDSVLKCLCSLYDKINSPLYHVLKVSANFNPETDMKETNIVEIKENGIFFKMNGKSFYVGNAEYVSNLGVLIPENTDENFDDTFIKSSGNIMYFSSEEEIIGKFYLKYELTLDFADIIKNLARLNICLGIRTSDPNITNASIQKIVANKKTVIKVIKLYDVNERQVIEESLTTGIVSKGSVKSLIEALISCNKTNNVIKTNTLVQIIASVIGVALSCGMIFSGDISKISVLHLILYQAFWFLPVLLLSNLTPH